MKKLGISALVLMMAAALATVNGQGTMQFSVDLAGANEVPPNGSPRTGSGTLTLTGSSLDYYIAFSSVFGSTPTDATINGPAGVGFTAPVIFDLGAPLQIFPNPPPLNWYVQGTLNNLTTGQISDLSAGLWYVDPLSSTTLAVTSEDKEAFRNDQQSLNPGRQCLKTWIRQSYCSRLNVFHPAELDARRGKVLNRQCDSSVTW